jgi:hypothetical protein
LLVDPANNEGLSGPSLLKSAAASLLMRFRLRDTSHPEADSAVDVVFDVLDLLLTRSWEYNFMKLVAGAITVI